MAHRLYFGNLDPSITQQDLEEECKRFGRTASVWVARSPPGFAFVEFDDIRDAEDCVRGLHDTRLGQQRVRVEFARNRGKNTMPASTGAAPGGYGAAGARPAGPGGRGTKHRAILKNLPASFSWKELKDEMRRIGDVIYADVDSHGDGVVEFATVDDLEYAVRKLDGCKLDGNIVTVYKENTGGGGGAGGGGRGGGHDDRYDDRGYEYQRRDDRRDDRRGDDHRRDDDQKRDSRRDDDYKRDSRRDDRRYDDEHDERPRGRGRSDRYDD